jgi:hypothetical protein
MKRIPDAIDLIRTNPAIAGNLNIFIGGDFNCNPRVRNNRLSTSAFPIAQGINAPNTVPLPQATRPPQWAAEGQLGGTTMNGAESLYDYFFSSITPVISGRAIAGIDTRAMDRWPGGEAIFAISYKLGSPVALWVNDPELL